MDWLSQFFDGKVIGKYFKILDKILNIFLRDFFINSHSIPHRRDNIIHNISRMSTPHCSR